MNEETWFIDVHHTVMQVMYPLPARLALTLRETIAALRHNPYPSHRRPIAGIENTYEVIVGFFRIIYQIQVEKKRIKVAIVNLRIE